MDLEVPCVLLPVGCLPDSLGSSDRDADFEVPFAKFEPLFFLEELDVELFLELCI